MIYRFGEFEFDPAGGELRKAGRAVPLQPKPFALLTVLVEERDRVVSAEELLERLWPDETVTPSSLARAVSVARRALGDGHAQQRIRSHKRRGYRFHDHVVELDHPSESEPASDDGHGRDDTLPFVGRQNAWEQVGAAWQRAAEGRGGTVVLVGPPGIGKTRLAERFALEVERRGGLALRGRALEEEGEPAFWVWAQVVRGLREATPEAVHAGVATSGALAALVPELDSGMDDAVANLPEEQRRFVFFAGVAASLREAARRQPVLVVFEDIHWADPASQRLLEHLAFELDDAAVLILATVRDPATLRHPTALRTLAALRRHEYFEEVSLAPFSVGELEELLERWAGGSRRELAEPLHARTDGVPLFVREALRRLSRVPTADDLATLELGPAASQIDWVGDALRSVSDRCADLLAAASVIGRHFPLSLAAGAADIPSADASDLLDEAIEAGVIQPDPESPTRFGFAHDLFREAAYEALRPGRRARLHQRTAELLERRHGEDLDPILSELAYHRYRGLAVGDPDLTYERASRAAARAFESRGYEHAARHWKQALAALDHLETPDPERQLEALLGFGEASRLSGERDTRRESFGKAMALARSLGRDDKFAMAAIGLCDVAEWGVRDEAARAALEEALARVDRGSDEIKARLLTRLGYLDSIEHRGRAEASLRQAVRIARELGASDALEESLYALHLTLGGPDDKLEREEILNELRGATSAARDRVASVIAVLDVAGDQLELGHFDAAASLRAEADTIAGEPAHPRTIWHRLVYDTGVALLRGDFDEVKRRANEAGRLGLRIQHPYARRCRSAQLAALAAERGAHQRVLACYEPGLSFEEGPIQWVKAHVARAQLALGREREARSTYREVAAEGFAAIPRNLRWIGTLTEVAHCAADLEDVTAAEPLLELLDPFEQRHAVMPIAICYGGPVSWAMARLQELSARADEADALYETALDAATALGARPTQARIHLSHGRFLRRRRVSRARDHLQEAAALAAEHGMVTVENDARSLLT